MDLKIDAGLPVALDESHWKGSKDVASALTDAGLPGLLKELAKRHGAIDFGAFANDKLTTAADAQKRVDAAQAAQKKALKPLLEQLRSIEAAARKVLAALKSAKTDAKKGPAALQEIIAAAGRLAVALPVHLESAVGALEDRLADLLAAEEEAARKQAAKDAKEGKPDAGPMELSKPFLLLRKKAIEGLRLVKNTPPPALLEKPVCYLVALGAKACRVYLARSVGGAQRNLLKGLMPGEKGIKYFTGNVIWEAKAHTFVGAQMPGGFAKRVQRGLLEQTKGKFRIRARKLDGDGGVDEEAGADDPDRIDDTTGELADKPAAPNAPPKSTQQRLADLRARFARLKPDMDAALAAKGPKADAIQQTRDLIERKLKEGKPDPVQALIGRLEDVVLMAVAQAEPAADDSGGAADGGSPEPGGKDAPAKGPATDEGKVDEYLEIASDYLGSIPAVSSADPLRVRLKKLQDAQAKARALADAGKGAAAFKALLALAKSLQDKSNALALSAGGESGDKPAGDTAMPAPQDAMAAPPDEKPPGSQGGGTGDRELTPAETAGDHPDSMSDADRKESLRRWKKLGAIDGDAEALAKALGDKNDVDAQAKARAEVKRLHGEIVKGQKPAVREVQPQAGPAQDEGGDRKAGQPKGDDDSGSKRDAPMSEANKQKLEQAVRGSKANLKPIEIKDFGNWLKRTHDEADFHKHLLTPESTRAKVLEWMQELGWQSHKKEGLRIKFSELHQKVHGDLTTGSRTSRADRPMGVNTDGGVKEAAPTVKSPDAAVQELDHQMIEHTKKMDEWVKRADDLKARRDKATTLEEKAALDKVARKLRKQFDDLTSQAQLLAMQSGKLDSAGQFKASSGKQALELARRPQKGSATLGGMGATLGALATAYFLAQDVKYILEADSALQALERIGEVGGKYAVGAAEFGVIKFLTGSNLATLGVQFLLSLDDRSGAQKKADERAAKEKADEEQKRAQASAEHVAVAQFLLAHVPGVVEFVEDDYKILNRKVYDEAVKKVRLLKRQHADAKQEAYRRGFALGLADGKTGKRSQRAQLTSFPELLYLPGGGAVPVQELFVTYERGFLVGSSRQRARALGVQDAKVHGRIVSGEAIKSWPEVKQGEMKEEELFVEYRDALMEQIKPRTQLLKRASELGHKDGKLKKKLHLDDMFKWPEVGKLIKDGAIPPDLYRELVESYTRMYDIATGNSSG